MPFFEKKKKKSLLDFYGKVVKWWSEKAEVYGTEGKGWIRVLCSKEDADR